MTARIHQRPKNAMQSGRARVGQWLLEFDAAEAKRFDPLTGWHGSGDVAGQVRLAFDDLDAAKAYAEANGIDYVVVPLGPTTIKLQAYADNFR